MQKQFGLSPGYETGRIARLQEDIGKYQKNFKVICKKIGESFVDAVIAKLNENLQVLFRKALDADKALDELKGQGKGKHSAIFPKEVGFTASSDRFTPYIAELSDDISSLNELTEKQKKEQLNLLLSTVIRKMESIFVTLAQFEGVLAEK